MLKCYGVFDDRYICRLEVLWSRSSFCFWLLALDFLSLHSFKVEVVSLPLSELVAKFSQALQRFVNNCCVYPQEGDDWEHRTKPKLILVSSDEVLSKVLETITGRTMMVTFNILSGVSFFRAEALWSLFGLVRLCHLFLYMRGQIRNWSIYSGINSSLFPIVSVFPAISLFFLLPAAPDNVYPARVVCINHDGSCTFSGSLHTWSYCITY